LDDPVLGVAGITFSIVLIGVAIFCHEDPLDDLVVRFGKKYGIVD
jgi:hypothetical protein